MSVICTACSTRVPPAKTSDHLSSDFLRKRKHIEQPESHTVTTRWRPASIDVGRHVVYTDIPAHWPGKPQMRVTKRDGRSIEFYPPGGTKAGNRITIAHIQTRLSPEAFAAVDLKRLTVFCGARHTRGNILKRHGTGVTAQLLCGSLGGSTGTSTGLNAQGEVTLYRLEQAPGGIYKIAHHWPGKAFNVHGDPRFFPVVPRIFRDHSDALMRTVTCPSDTSAKSDCRRL